MKKLAIITTHPIQYNAPLFEALSRRGKVNIKVFYTWGEKVMGEKYDPGFGKNIQWDIPLLDNYNYSFVENIAKEPGSHHFTGIDNPGLIDAINEWNADVVMVYGWNFKSHLKCIRHFKGKKKVCFRGDSTLLDEEPGYSFKKIIRKTLLQWVYKNVDTAFYAGEANKAYYIKMGLRESQLRFMPHAIDNSRFEVRPVLSMREKLKIAEDDIVFLYAGKLEPKKDPMLLLDAFSKIDQPGIKLIIAGNGVEEKKLKETVLALDPEVARKIIFSDFINQADMPAMYQAADIFVLPSRGPGETWGLSVNEAMAAGCAVLVSDKCGCAYDIVQNGKNGYVFKSGDAGELSAYMRNLAEDKSRLREMREASREIISPWSLLNAAMAVEDEINL